MAKKKEGKGKGTKKYGRNKRPVNSAMSAYVRGKITFESYQKQTKKVWMFFKSWDMKVCGSPWVTPWIPRESYLHNDIAGTVVA